MQIFYPACLHYPHKNETLLISSSGKEVFRGKDEDAQKAIMNERRITGINTAVNYYTVTL